MIWERRAESNETALLTFAMVTVAANRLIGEITDRMPAVIAPEHWGTWLGETHASAEELKALLVPFEGDWTMRSMVEWAAAREAFRGLTFRRRHPSTRMRNVRESSP